MTENQEIRQSIDLVGTLDAVLTRADGTIVNLGQLSGPQNYKLVGRPVQWWRALWRSLRKAGIIPMGLGFAAFLATYGVVGHMAGMETLFKDPRVIDIILPQLGLVVTGGMNYLASDFAAGLASPRISAMNYHDAGTSTVAATSTDSGLGTPWGGSRVSGTQTNPATNQYKTSAQITFNNTFTITEWAVFSASSTGTMWDRRVFTGIGVGNGDSITFNYSLVLTAGGS